MKTSPLPSRFSWFFAGVLLAGAVQMSCAQSTGWVLQTFDSNICGWDSFPGVTLAFDPTQDDTGNGGGSCHVRFDLSQNGVFAVNGSFESCCFCELEQHLAFNNYASVDFDVKWDNSTSTVTPDQFNSNSGSGSPGLTVGAINPGFGYLGYPTICYSNVCIPGSVTSGWVHVSAPINPTSTASTNGGTGIYLFESFPASSSGTAAFWLDNVKLTGLKPPQFLPAALCLASNAFTLQWTANPGSTCTLLKSADLVNWSRLVTGYPPGGITTGTASYTDPNATNRQSFYIITTP
jgi:hypothetical protein